MRLSLIRRRKLNKELNIYLDSLRKGIDKLEADLTESGNYPTSFNLKNHED
jgi:hypothetical protein